MPISTGCGCGSHFAYSIASGKVHYSGEYEEQMVVRAVDGVGQADPAARGAVSPTTIREPTRRQHIQKTVSEEDTNSSLFPAMRL